MQALMAVTVRQVQQQEILVLALDQPVDTFGVQAGNARFGIRLVSGRKTVAVRPEKR